MGCIAVSRAMTSDSAASTLPAWNAPVDGQIHQGEPAGQTDPQKLATVVSRIATIRAASVTTVIATAFDFTLSTPVALQHSS